MCKKSCKLLHFLRDLLYDENLFYLPGCIHDAGGWLLGGGGGGADSKEGGGTPMQKRNTQHYKMLFHRKEWISEIFFYSLNHYCRIFLD